MNHHPEGFPADPSTPRGFKAILIHLAGADPKVFQHLPPSEASEYAKMGFTVLIPFVLALAAGTFTLYTLQDTPKSLLMALPFGIIWALMILGMDVAIMSQLAKRAPITAVSAYVGPRQAYGAPVAPVPPQPRASGGGGRRFVLATLRMMIAATLGLVMSHCLVLAIFKGRVQSRIEETRTVQRGNVESKDWPAVQKLQQEAATALRVSSIVSRDQFLAAFNNLQVDLGAKVTPSDETKSGSTGPAVDNSISEALKPYDAQIAQLTTAAEAKISAALVKDKEIERLNEELVQAEKVWHNERDGIEGTYTWYTPTFKAVMPAETSPKKGVGSRANFIRTQIDEAKRTIESYKTEAARLKENADKAEKEVQLAIDKKNAEKAKLLENNTKGLVDKMAAYEATQKTTESMARSEVDRIVRDLTARRDAAQSQYDTRVKPITGASYDLLEQTEALHDLALGKADEAKGSKQWTILGLIILILICLMFIDLTPLMMKLMHPPSHYEQYLARPLSAAGHNNLGRHHETRHTPTGQSPTGGASYSTLPPPPPPRRR